MKVYFFDENKRYIGNRELINGEEIPYNATSEIAIVKDGQEAYLVDNKWIISDIAGLIIE